MVQALGIFLLALVPFMFEGSYNIIIDLLNALIVALGPAVIRVIGLFPANPCGSLIASCSTATATLTAPSSQLLTKGLSTLCWLLPVQYLANLVGCIMLSVMIYFTMAPLARWLKLMV